MCVVTADDGTWGLGMTTHAGPVVPVINDYLAPMLLDEDPFDIERLWDMMATACGAHFGVAGIASHALSAVDLALWDLKGKAHGLPVYELLGGATHEAITCYATGMDMEANAARGFEAFKLPCPWGPDRARAVDNTVSLIEGARSVIGSDAHLMLDCWAVLDVDGAVAIGEAVEPFALTWLEDYVVPDDWPGYLEVRDRLPHTRLAAGERWYTDRPFEHMASVGAVDVVQPDALWVGGVTPTMRVASIAEEHGIEIAIHCGGNDSYGQHLCFAIAGNSWGEMYIEANADATLMGSYRATPGMSLPVNGQLVPNPAPGFGIELTLSDIEAAT